ncbi:hypothetical protein EIP75_21665 [Aquabacterium soli]|uniref:Uncharacterized protein n=1 Tax=Aquabacterium soli TaxID=2493092 RepID=A0A3R8RYZ8_9BURK|nr:hypothetical protein [Aquabacterium soli]RRS01186.1 hypothetical protein EIP75_21665 [Aquabacterium soli]
MSYYNRNSRWLAPLLVIALLTLTPVVLSTFDVNRLDGGGPMPPVPVWMATVAKVGVVLATVLAALGACFTNTLSAHLARVVLPGIALGVLLAEVGLSGPQLLIAMALLWIVLGGLDYRSGKV